MRKLLLATIVFFCTISNSYFFKVSSFVERLKELFMILRKKTFSLLILSLGGGLLGFWFVWANSQHPKVVDSKIGEELVHLSLIMDGNRRWAANNGKLAGEGHYQGALAIRKAVDFCLAEGIKHLSLYAFSLENLNRSQEEKRDLFDLIPKFFEKYSEELLAKKVRIRFIGDRNLFPLEATHCITQIEKITNDCDSLNVYFMFFYGGQQEIIAGMKKIGEKIKAGEVEPEAISQAFFEQQLWSVGVPDPDLLIRFGGRKRLSNFLPFKLGYTELCFLDNFWPDVNEKILKKCCQDFLIVGRTFGH